MAMQTDRLVDDYQLVEEAAAHLQRSRRAELIAEIRPSTAPPAALREEEAAGGSHTFSNGSGRPEEIVEAAEPGPEAEQRPTRGGRHGDARRPVHRLALRHRDGPDLQGVVEPRQVALLALVPFLASRDRRQLLGEHVHHVRDGVLRLVGHRGIPPWVCACAETAERPALSRACKGRVHQGRVLAVPGDCAAQAFLKRCPSSPAEQPLGLLRRAWRATWPGAPRRAPSASPASRTAPARGRRFLRHRSVPDPSRR